MEKTENRPIEPSFECSLDYSAWTGRGGKLEGKVKDFEAKTAAGAEAKRQKFIDKLEERGVLLEVRGMTSLGLVS